MAVNKVNLGNEELINLTQDTIEPGAVVSGFTFHGSDGEIKEGTLGEATQEQAGLMSAEDKVKLDGMPESIAISGTTEYWTENHTYIPAKGTIIIYEDYTVDEDENPIPAFKVADGKAYVSDLPFAAFDGFDDLKAHLGNTEIHITQAEREFWNNKWRGYIDILNPDNLIFTVN